MGVLRTAEDQGGNVMEEVHAVLLFVVVGCEVGAFAEGVVASSIFILVIQYAGRNGRRCARLVAESGVGVAEVILEKS